MNFRFKHPLGSIRTRNPNRVSDANRKLKRGYDRDGIGSCEACDWTAPPAIVGFAPCLRVHHIVPLCLDGPLEDRRNTALLCPNHAAIGDALAAQSCDVRGNYLGPKNREELFRMLKVLDEGRGLPLLLIKATLAMEGFKANDRKE